MQVGICSLLNSINARQREWVACVVCGAPRERFDQRK